MEAVKSKHPELNEFQLNALKDAEAKLEKMRSDMQTRKYLIDLKKDDITLLSEFINKDAKWKFTECLGIIEVTKELETCIKSGKLFTTAVAIEAIYYYMSKVEGKGNSTDAVSSISKLPDYLRILKEITNGVERIKNDGDAVRNEEFIVAARREGIEPDASLSLTETKDETNS